MRLWTNNTHTRKLYYVDDIAACNALFNFAASILINLHPFVIKLYAPYVNACAPARIALFIVRGALRPGFWRWSWPCTPTGKPNKHSKNLMAYVPAPALVYICKDVFTKIVHAVSDSNDRRTCTRPHALYSLQTLNAGNVNDDDCLAFSKDLCPS